MKAGLRRSMDTVSVRPLFERVKYLSFRSITRKGPSYGRCNGPLVASWRTNTCVALCRASGMCDDRRGPWCCAGTGRCRRIVSRSRSRREVGSGLVICEKLKNSPGSRSVEPYTNSAGLHCKSSFTAVRIPSMTIGSSSRQFVLFKRAFKDVFSWRWKRSTIPFVCGW